MFFSSKKIRFFLKKIPFLSYPLSKRIFDILLSSFLLLLLWPLFLLIAIIIKLTSPGPCIFWQKRVGLAKKEFDFPKFRTMVVNAEQLKYELLSQNDHPNNMTFKMKSDPRVTKIGKILRKTSLDELPQLWCVFKGEMTLVGPRPPVSQEVALYSKEGMRRFEVKPGLTCIWQISGRSELPFQEQLKMDLEYIEKQNFWLDLKILFLTIPAVFTGRGAY